MSILSPVVAGSTRKSVRDLFRVAAFPVAAGATTQVAVLNDVDATFITLMSRADVAHTHEPTVQWLAQTGLTPAVNSTIAPSFVPDNLRWDGTLRYASGWLDVISPRLYVYIRNQDTVDHTYDFVINGIG